MRGLQQLKETGGGGRGSWVMLGAGGVVKGSPARAPPGMHRVPLREQGGDERAAKASDHSANSRMKRREGNPHGLPGRAS